MINDKTLVFSDEWHARFLQYTIEYYGIALKEKMVDFLKTNNIEEHIFEELDFGLGLYSRMKDVVFACYIKIYNYFKEGNIKKEDFEELEKNCKDKLFEELDSGYTAKKII